MYNIKINQFEGPFDLLVYLIEQARMNIYDISISEITEQYIDKIKKLQELDIEITSDFIVLASNLIQIKSKMLLPRLSPDESEFLYEDPRKDLVERLIEYKTFKNATAHLSDLENESLKIHKKPKSDISTYTNNPDETLNLSIEEFISAFYKFITKKEKTKEIKDRYEHIPRNRISDSQRLEQIKDLFKEIGFEKLPFSKTIFDKEDNYDIALSFVTILELVKQNKLTAEQQSLFDEIFLQQKKEV
ncbi:MAG: segregation/condensation protein A [Eubacteriales bacterium]|nr:segregation/condensation protein A [Eubacteriales bacterium]MDY3332430.1 segregation/condensation protein A [Gallibacter sp.]